MLKNKNIAFLGLGIENLALIKFILKEKINCQMTVCDFKNEQELGEKYNNLKGRKNVHWKLGKEANKNLDGFVILFRSPGWPLFDKGVLEAKKLKVKIANPLEFFIRLCPSKNIIGVTGRKAIEAKDAKAKELVAQTMKALDKAAQKGIIKKNNRDRKKSRLHTKLNAMLKK